MEGIQKHLQEGKIINIFCRNGVERKIYHQWAKKNGYSSIPSKNKKFETVYLYRCPECYKKNYIKDCVMIYPDELEIIKFENYVPDFLNEESWTTRYDCWDGRIYSYAVMCDYCADDIDDYFVIVGEGKTADEVNYYHKIMIEAANCVLICDYNKVDSKLQTRLRRHGHYYGNRSKSSDFTDSDLINKVASLDDIREYVVID